MISSWILLLALATSKYRRVWHFIVVHGLFACFFFTESPTAICSKFVDVFLLLFEKPAATGLELQISCPCFQPAKPHSAAVFALNQLLKMYLMLSKKKVLNTHTFFIVSKRYFIVIVAANHNTSFTIRFYYSWDLGFWSGKKRHPGCKHKIPVQKDHVMKVDMAFFPLIYDLTASILRGRFKFYHFRNPHKWWRVRLWFENISTRRRTQSIKKRNNT